MSHERQRKGTRRGDDSRERLLQQRAPPAHVRNARTFRIEMLAGGRQRKDGRQMCRIDEKRSRSPVAAIGGGAERDYNTLLIKSSLDSVCEEREFQIELRAPVYSWSHSPIRSASVRGAAGRHERGICVCSGVGMPRAAGSGRISMLA